jgi:uncharacterized protein (DUF2062 family)
VSEPDGEPAAAEHRPRFVERRLVRPVRRLLDQGITPEQLALCFALGVTLGVFPIIGATTLLCIGAGLALRLNQPALQIVNYAVYPLQIPLVLVFVRLGERLLGAPPMPFSPGALVNQFREAPGLFVERFGMTGLHGILGWGLTAPALGAALYWSALPALRRAAPTPRPGA